MEKPCGLLSMGSHSRIRLKEHSTRACIGEGNGNPLQYSCLENPRDGGAWLAAVHGVSQSQTWVKRLSSSTSSIHMSPSSLTSCSQPPSHPTPLGCHRVQVVLYSNFPLAICFIYGNVYNVYISVLLSRLAHPFLPSLCPQSFSISESLFLPCT